MLSKSFFYFFSLSIWQYRLSIYTERSAYKPDGVNGAPDNYILYRLYIQIVRQTIGKNWCYFILFCIYLSILL